MNNIPFSQARARLAQTLSEVEAAREPTVISRRGRPAVVMVSLAQYERLGGPEADFASQLAAWRKRHSALLTSEEPDPWADVRDPVPGRASPW